MMVRVQGYARPEGCGQTGAADGEGQVLSARQAVGVGLAGGRPEVVGPVAEGALRGGSRSAPARPSGGGGRGRGSGVGALPLGCAGPYILFGPYMVCRLVAWGGRFYPVFGLRAGEGPLEGPMMSFWQMFPMYLRQSAADEFMLLVVFETVCSHRVRPDCSFSQTQPK